MPKNTDFPIIYIKKGEILMKIRKFKEKDAKEVSDLIIRTLKETSIKDYSKAYIENLSKAQSTKALIEFSKTNNFYLGEEDGKIVACGAIGPYKDKKDEACLYKIFIDPAYQKRGYVREIMKTLEKDLYYQKAKRIEVPASISALDFYLKLGYDFKDGGDKLDENLLYGLEKFS